MPLTSFNEIAEREPNGAVLSIDEAGAYRWLLWRKIALPFSKSGRGNVLFIMLNPSTADASVDDPTIRRCRGFAESWGYGRLIVANLYGWRSPNRMELRRRHSLGEDPVGHRNDEYLRWALRNAADVVAAWGADTGPVPSRVEHVRYLVDRAGHPLQSITKHIDGRLQPAKPRHPLYLAKEEVLELCPA